MVNNAVTNQHCIVRDPVFLHPCPCRILPAQLTTFNSSLSFLLSAGCKLRVSRLRGSAAKTRITHSRCSYGSREEEEEEEKLERRSSGLRGMKMRMRNCSHRRTEREHVWVWSFDGSFLSSRTRELQLMRFVCLAEPYLIAKLDSAERTYKELSVRLADPDVASNNNEYQKLAKTVAELEEVVTTYRDFKTAEVQLEEAKELAKESAGDDKDMAAMAADEANLLAQKLESLEDQLKMLLLPSDPLDARNIMLEVRAGTGGDEAGIWAGDLVRMYQKFAERNSWKFSTISCTEAERGGYKEFVLEITGE
jgi:hypothetical protein